MGAFKDIKSKKFLWKLTPIALVIGQVFAQSDQNIEPSVLEVVYIKGLKRTVDIMNVPYSIAAFSSDQIRNMGAYNYQEMTLSTPGVNYGTASGASDLFYVRGLGTSGSGPQFESAVGLIINDQFVGRSRLGRSGLFDIEQIEIFKGPPGAVIGKNTSLGAIVITPNAPTENFQAGVNVSYEFESTDGLYTESFVSGALTNTVNARLALSYKDQDQLVDSPNEGPDANDEDLNGRLTVSYSPTNRLQFVITSQQSEYERNGAGRELSFCNNPVAVFNAQGEDCRVDGKTTATGLPDDFDPNTGFDNDSAGLPFDLSVNLSSLKATYEFEQFALTSITGYQDSDIVNTLDSDQTRRQTRLISNREQFEQISQEIRLLSLDNYLEGRLSWITGVYYLDNTMDFEQLSDFSAFFGQSLRRQQLVTVDTQSFSAFAEVDYVLTAQLTATLGARYTDETRDGSVLQTNYSPKYTYNNPAVNCNTPGPGAGFRICNQADDDFDSQQTQYNGSLRYQLTDNDMFYFTVSTGFKSGGFNMLSGQTQTILQQTFIFDDEESLNIELGGKHIWGDGRFQINWGVFNTSVDNLQISQNIAASIVQIINNAGEVKSTGLEIDAVVLLSDAFKASLNGAFIDAEYKSFLGAGCYSGQTAAQGCVNESQDLSGVRPTRAPKNQLKLEFEYTLKNLAPNADVILSTNAVYTSDYTIDVSNDPVTAQGDTTKISAAVSLVTHDDQWEISLIGRNLTDEITGSFASSTTAVNGPLGGGGRFIHPDDMRSISLQIEYYFQD